MIRSFRHKGLARLWNENDARGVRADLVERIRLRLRAIHAARALSELNVPGFDFHGLRGKPKRYSIHINGPFCLTFEWLDGEAVHMDLEQYH
jgi:proteic killer suppression protein